MQQVIGSVQQHPATEQRPRRAHGSTSDLRSSRCRSLGRKRSPRRPVPPFPGPCPTDWDALDAHPAQKGPREDMRPSGKERALWYLICRVLGSELHPSARTNSLRAMKSLPHHTLILAPLPDMPAVLSASAPKKANPHSASWKRLSTGLHRHWRERSIMIQVV